PGMDRRSALLLLAVAIAVKLAFPAQPWGLPFRPGTKVALAPVLSRYCERGRANPLVIFGVDDALCASVLPLPRIRYAFLNLKAPPEGYALDFRGMGIMLTAQQFAELPKWQEISRNRLRAWGLDSVEPVGTVILPQSREDVGLMLRSHPESDFLVPEQYRPSSGPMAEGQHHSTPAIAGYFFPLASAGRDSVQQRQGCDL